MATIDLGKIKLVWRGTYSGGTAYTVDDVVQHTDSGLTSSFICTTNSTGNAPSTGGSVHSSWAYLAKGGVAGNDFGLANKEIAFKTNAGALDGIPIGTAGQALKVNSGATGYEFGTAGGILQYKHTMKTDTQAISSNNFGGTLISGLSVSITPSSTNNRILVAVGLQTDNTNGYRTGGYIFRDGTKIGIGTSVGSRTALTFGIYGNPNQHHSTYQAILDTPPSTSSLTYTVGLGTEGSSGTVVVNRDMNDNNDSTHGRMSSFISAMEIASGVL